MIACPVFHHADIVMDHALPVAIMDVTGRLTAPNCMIKAVIMND